MFKKVEMSSDGNITDIVNKVADIANEVLDVIEDLNSLVHAVKRSPPDARDWKYLDKAKPTLLREAGLPAAVDYREYLNRVRSQGTEGTCAAFSAAVLKEVQEARENPAGFKGNKDFYMSPRFVYTLRDNHAVDGMYPRDVMRILSNYGVCFESTLPYKAGQPLKVADLTQEQYAEAANFKIAGYAIVSSVEEAKTALAEKGPLLAAFPVWNTNAEFWKQGAGNAFKGGHAVCIVGYDDNKDGQGNGAFLIRNSWGTNWAEGGYTSWRYSDWGQHWEVWSAVDAVSDPKVVPPVVDEGGGCCKGGGGCVVM